MNVQFILELLYSGKNAINFSDSGKFCFERPLVRTHVFGTIIIYLFATS